MAISILKGAPPPSTGLRGVKKYGKLYSGNRVAMTAVEKGEVPVLHWPTIITGTPSSRNRAAPTS